MDISDACVVGLVEQQCSDHGFKVSPETALRLTRIIRQQQEQLESVRPLQVMTTPQEPRLPSPLWEPYELPLGEHAKSPVIGRWRATFGVFRCFIQVEAERCFWRIETYTDDGEDAELYGGIVAGAVEAQLAAEDALHELLTGALGDLSKPSLA